ncbi:hypothetical protein NDN08_003314 [Rhodosorus marinus]|uniref:Uncharacterized protein n=1 Tax=Rhodosorus marinus TaxID=101924 RepID=A0AAV8UW57_9RHOD|nr:hypothetical protein NDN08_003314 [Rhodosorus marinus]
MDEVDDLLESLEALAATRKVLTVPNRSSKGVIEGESSGYGAEDALEDYFADDVSSVGVEEAEKEELVEQLKVQKRKVRRVLKEVVSLKEMYGRERALRVQAEEKLRRMENERSRTTSTMDSLVGLLRDANECLQDQSRRLQDYESSIAIDLSLNAAGPGDGFYTGGDVDTPREESSASKLGVKDLEELLRSRSHEMEISEAKISAMELELSAAKSALAAERIDNIRTDEF